MLIRQYRALRHQVFTTLPFPNCRHGQFALSLKTTLQETYLHSSYMQCGSANEIDFLHFLYLVQNAKVCFVSLFPKILEMAGRFARE